MLQICCKQLRSDDIVTNTTSAGHRGDDSFSFFFFVSEVKKFLLASYLTFFLKESEGNDDRFL